jgi:prevent-host-death family protein
MKVISIDEAQANLGKYAEECRSEPIIVEKNGKPVFEIVPLESNDDFIDTLIANNPKFQAELERRKTDRKLSTDELLSKL